MNKKIFFLPAVLAVSIYSIAQTPNRDSLFKEAAKTEIYAPVPPIVTPGSSPLEAPSDAIILFNGKRLDAWFGDDSTKAAGWDIADGIMTVNKKMGGIMTKQKFLDYQLHIEWRIPVNISGEGQMRGNSGVWLARTGVNSAGYDEGYHIQILDSYKNTTYVNGQAGALYKQSIPLVNPCKKPGEWQTYDIIWKAPRFNRGGSLNSPGFVTVIYNGVLVQDHAEVKGITQWIGNPYYKAHGALPVKLEMHEDPSEPISFRNIWIRLL